MADAAPTPPRLSPEDPASRGLNTRMPHLRAPLNVEMNINLRTAADPAVANGGKQIPLADALPEASMKRLLAIEPQVMKWLAASDDNRLLFLTDPVAALLKIEPGLDKGLVKQLVRTRQRMSRDLPEDPRVLISQVRVAAVPPRRDR